MTALDMILGLEGRVTIYFRSNKERLKGVERLHLRRIVVKHGFTPSVLAITYQLLEDKRQHSRYDILRDSTVIFSEFLALVPPPASTGDNENSAQCEFDRLLREHLAAHPHIHVYRDFRPPRSPQCRPTSLRSELDAHVSALLREPSPPPPEGNERPSREMGSQEYVRDPAVVAYVLRLASGTCELCGSPGPFISASHGMRYLEVHHVRMLSEGGPDTVDNCVAACPACHRRFHHSVDRDEFRDHAYRTVGRLKRV